MANLTITRDCITTAPQSATADYPDHSSNHTPAPVSAGVWLEMTSVWTYFPQYSYHNIPVAIVQRPGTRILTMVLPSGEMARIWEYAEGVGVQVKSKRHAGVWYEVTAARCECPHFHYQHACGHQDAAEQAITVWRRLSAIAAQKGMVA